jgi:lytic murein transglycosylase
MRRTPAALLPAALALLLPLSALAQDRNCQNTGSFERWLEGFRKEAAAQGVTKRTIAAALDAMTLDTGIIARDRRQGFFAQSFLDFQGKLATNNRLTNAKAKVAQQKAVFARAEKEFGVPAAVITGFWALESDFGLGMGKLPILNSLVALAYDCRRGDMFRAELLAALKIIDRGDMTPADMIGSWAGEIGQTQFLPTRYLDHAIDYDGDGRPNLFKSDADVIGSTANYMKHLGWRGGEPWLEEVAVPDSLDWKEADLAIQHPRAKWAAWGVTRVGGGSLVKDQLPASLLLPMGRHGPAFLAYPNFRVYLEWNQSLTYATTAAYLATRIDGAPPMSKGKPGIPVLAIEEAKELQRLLAKRRHDVGDVDGKIGEKTRQAVKAEQIRLRLPADSYPTPDLLDALRRGS